MEPCKLCDGHGKLTTETDDIVTTECPACGGTGVIPVAEVDVWW